MSDHFAGNQVQPPFHPEDDAEGFPDDQTWLSGGRGVPEPELEVDDQTWLAARGVPTNQGADPGVVRPAASPTPGLSGGEAVHRALTGQADVYRARPPAARILPKTVHATAPASSINPRTGTQPVPRRRGSGGALVIALAALVFLAAIAGLVYLIVA